ncbi:hypothetical protein F511_42457 [Dorcoceras hygrometricum]|uniref:Uncharacterized protein n=1 Tax=Dorcoceras hygrometricum TaxID=472368 RepID=A0A2Z7CI01_9LAMI|nr:hypothetical protein F511_42457 [Dorcoceras hygrometricum]
MSRAMYAGSIGVHPLLMEDPKQNLEDRTTVTSPRGSPDGDNTAAAAGNTRRAAQGRTSSTRNDYAAVGHLEHHHRPPSSASSCRDRTCSDQLFEEFPSVPNSSVLLVQANEGIVFPVVDLIRRSTATYIGRARFPVILVGARRLVWWNRVCVSAGCSVEADVNAGQHSCSSRGNVVVLLLRLEVQLRVIFAIVACCWYLMSAAIRFDDVSGATSFGLVATLRFEFATGTSSEKRCIVLFFRLDTQLLV